MSLCITRLMLATYFLARVSTMAPLSPPHLPVSLIQQPTPSSPLVHGAIQSIGRKSTGPPPVTLWRSLICSRAMQSYQLPHTPTPPHQHYRLRLYPTLPAPHKQGSEK